MKCCLCGYYLVLPGGTRLFVVLRGLPGVPAGSVICLCLCADCSCLGLCWAVEEWGGRGACLLACHGGESWGREWVLGVCPSSGAHGDGVAIVGEDSPCVDVDMHVMLMRG